jgi:hypothetical protein
MFKYFITLCFIFIHAWLSSQTYPDLNYSETGNINLFYTENADDDAQFIAMITHEANLFFANTFGDLGIEVNLLVLNPIDWKKYAIQGAIYGMPHFKPSENSIIVAAEDNPFWKAQLPDVNNIKAPHKDLLKLTYTMQDGSMSARNFFDLLAIHELAHLWSQRGKRTIQRLWLEEMFCNLALHTFIEEERSEWFGALTALPSYHALNDEVKMKYTTLESFEADYYKIGLEAPHNYGWYQYRFHHAARLIYTEGGKEVIKKLWDFLGKYKDKLSDEELKDKLAKEVHPYFKTLLEEW